jgi:hypothetical protein
MTLAFETTASTRENHPMERPNPTQKGAEDPPGDVLDATGFLAAAGLAATGTGACVGEEVSGVFCGAI